MIGMSSRPISDESDTHMPGHIGNVTDPLVGSAKVLRPEAEQTSLPMCLKSVHPGLKSYISPCLSSVASKRFTFCLTDY
jgi:hypothetical protein